MKNDMIIEDAYGTYIKIYDEEVYILTKGGNDRIRIAEVVQKLKDFHLEPNKFRYDVDTYWMRLIHAKKIKYGVFEFKYHLKIYKNQKRDWRDE